MEEAPDESPQALLAQRLRSIRTDNHLTLRGLAKRLNYKAHSNLSEYEDPKGRIAPVGFLETLARTFDGVNLKELLELRRRAVAEKAGGPGPEPVVEQTKAGRWRAVLRKRRVALSAAVALAGLVAVVSALWLRPGGHPSASKFDGEDPKNTHCDIDAVSLSTAPVTPTGQPDRVLGHLTLCYSHHCHSSWPLFVPTSLMPTGTTVKLVARRPATHGTAAYDFPNASAGNDVYGNMLDTHEGCTLVTVTLVDPNGAPEAAGSTDCRVD